MSWGVLAYIVADERLNLGETLDEAAKADLGKLLKAAHETGIPVAAQIDYEGEPGIWRQLRGADPASEPIEMRDANSNNPEVLQDFLKWGLEQVNTTHHLLLLWGHGTGPTGFFSDASEKTPARLGHPLSPRQLSRALHLAKKSGDARFDILLVKACFAATLEVAYQLQGAARYMIASQDLIPSQTFWPYTTLFKHLQTSADARDAAERLLAEIGDFYRVEANRPGKTEVPYSLLELGGAGAVARELKNLSDAIRTLELNIAEVTKPSPDKPSVRPGDPALLDIEQLCDRLMQRADLSSCAVELKSSLRNLVIRRLQDPTGGESIFRGVSLFYHPGYGMESPVRDSASFGLYKRTLMEQEKVGWSDIAYQNTAISRLI